MMSEYKCFGVIAEWNSEKMKIIYEPVCDEFADAWEVHEISFNGKESRIAIFKTRKLAEEFILLKEFKQKLK